MKILWLGAILWLAACTVSTANPDFYVGQRVEFMGQQAQVIRVLCNSSRCEYKIRVPADVTKAMYVHGFELKEIPKK